MLPTFVQTLAFNHETTSLDPADYHAPNLSGIL